MSTHHAHHTAGNTAKHHAHSHAIAENAERGYLLDQLQSCLTGHFDVEHSTFQLEPAVHAVHETGTH